MNVLHIAYSDNAGAGLAALRIHKSLKSIGIKSKMLVLYKTSTDNDVYVAKTESEIAPAKRHSKITTKILNWLKYKGLCLTPEEKDARYLNAIPSDKRTIFTSPISNIDIVSSDLIQEADIIHLHWIANFVDYKSFFNGVNKPIVWTLHDENIAFGGFHYKRDYEKSYSYYKNIEDKYLALKTKAISNNGNISYVALSHYMFSFYSQLPYINPKDIHCIHNAVDYNIFKMHDKKSARSILNIGQDKTVFAFCSVLLNDPRKGLLDLLDALESLQEHSKVVLICIGDGDLPRETSLSIIRTGMLYNQNLLALSLSCADYYALPSYQEAFAQTPLEAMACGVPVIAYPCSGTEELITEFNGVRCTDFSTDSLREGLSKALSNKYESSKIREDIIERFSPEKIANDYLSLYKMKLNKK